MTFISTLETIFVVVIITIICLMIKNFKILTITHRNTNLSELGNFVVKYSDQVDLKSNLHKLKDEFNLDELFYLATCNRVMYFFHTDQNINFNFTSGFFKKINPSLSQAEIDKLEEQVSFYEGEKALNHLFEVAASVDSLVVGEREILRQLREAYEQCYNWKLTGDNIRVAMNATVQNAKEVYSQTKIGEKPVSIVSLAIQKLLKSGLTKDARILMIGAGQTNHLVAKFLVKHEFSNLVVFNRSFDKAQQIAEMTGGQARTFSELKSYKEGFDCLIICTGATTALINDTLYQSLLNGDKNKKLVIDLSVPHNIAKTIAVNFNIDYVDVENLRNLAKENIAFREKEVVKVKNISAKNLKDFHTIYRQRQIERAMQKVPKEIKAVKSHAMNNVFKRELENIDEQSRDLLERMMSYMERRCISIPMQAAKNTQN
jgi:glutamyl-tRNA reductase